MNIALGCQLSALRIIVVGRRSSVVAKAKSLFAIHLFKHKNAPAMLPEHSVFLMAES
jgi:hypothetical protein